MSLGGSGGDPAYAFPGGGGCSEASSAQPEEFQPNAGPPVTVPAPQQPPSSHVFTCQYCAKQFNARWMLERHSVSHTGAQPYGCRLCDRRFAHQTSAVRHVRMLHKEETNEAGSMVYRV